MPTRKPLFYDDVEFGQEEVATNDLVQVHILLPKLITKSVTVPANNEVLFADDVLIDDDVEIVIEEGAEVVFV